MVLYPIHNSSNNQIWQDGRPACTNFTLQVMMVSPRLGYVTNSYGFIVSSIIPP